MLTEEQAAADYADARDGCRPLALGSRVNALHWRRLKPDPETTPLADLDFEKVPTWDDHNSSTPPRLRAHRLHRVGDSTSRAFRTAHRKRPRCCRVIVAS